MNGNQATLDNISTEVASSDELSYDELIEREHLERLVERAFYEAGRALYKLRKQKLYRNTHKTFEEYCLSRFAFTRRNVNYLIAGSIVVDNLKDTNDTQIEVTEFLGTNCSQILPTNECQVRPLTQLEPSEQRQCWRQAVEAAGNKVPSGRQVKGIVDKIRERTKLPNPHRKGEICTLIPKDNPELRGTRGCWGAITCVGEYSCTIETWEAEYTVKIEHLSSLELSDDNSKFMLELLGRMRRLCKLSERDAVVDNLLAFFGKQPLPYLTPIQEQILAIIERNYGIGEFEQ